MNEERVFFLHALSPLHAGTGQGEGAIDLPIARERATNLPIVPGSSIKGVKRDLDMAKDKSKAIVAYGPETNNASEHAGAILFGDARLVCLPVRSMRGTFAWVTSPLVLQRMARDFGDPVLMAAISFTNGKHVLVPKGSSLSVKKDDDEELHLEDLDIPATIEADEKGIVGNWAKAIADRVFGKTDPWNKEFVNRFAILDENVFQFLVKNATEVCARIKIDPVTKTASGTALWYEEALPAETILWGIAVAEKPHKKNVQGITTPLEVMNFVLPQGDTILQVGGKATVGRGRVRLIA